MKKGILTTLVFMLTAMIATAQVCNYDSDAVDEDEPGELWPDEVLPAYTCESLYNQVISLVVPATADILPLITCTVNSVTLDAVLGLPAGFTFACNPGSCSFPGGGTGCVSFAGNPSLAILGSYPLEIVVTNDVTCPLLGDIVMTDTIDNDSLGYTLDVLDCPDCTTLGAPIRPQTIVRTVTNKVQMDWSPVMGAIGYQVCGGPVGGGEGCAPPIIGNNSTLINFSQFSPGLIYRWHVRAGCGPAGPPITAFSVDDTLPSTVPPPRLANPLQSVQTSSASLDLYPNPATDRILMAFGTLLDGQGQVRIYDATGRVVFEESTEFFNGSNVVAYPVEEFESGIYILEVLQQGQTISKRFTVAE